MNADTIRLARKAAKALHDAGQEAWAMDCNNYLDVIEAQSRKLERLQAELQKAVEDGKLHSQLFLKRGVDLEIAREALESIKNIAGEKQCDGEPIFPPIFHDIAREALAKINAKE